MFYDSVIRIVHSVELFYEKSHGSGYIFTRLYIVLTRDETSINGYVHSTYTFNLQFKKTLNV